MEFWGFPVHFEVWGVLILLTAAATDWADGYFARRNEQVTTLGILLDPIADKLLISAAFISLVDMHLVAGWMVVIIIGREFTILGLRNIASAEGFTIAASALGKLKMVLQVCCVAVLIAGARHPSLRPISDGFALAGGGERAGFRRAILFALLGPTGRSHQAAPQAEHDRAPEKPARCCLSLKTTGRAILAVARQSVLHAVRHGWPLASYPTPEYSRSTAGCS